MLRQCEGVARRLDRFVVGAVAELERRGEFGEFGELGYKSAAVALADLLGWGRFEAAAGSRPPSRSASGSGWTGRCYRPGSRPRRRCSQPRAPACGLSR
jgi:hypothetical protein